MSLNICNINDFLYVAIRGCFIKSVFFDLGDKLLKKQYKAPCASSEQNAC